jgi:hypothetical protein
MSPAETPRPGAHPDHDLLADLAAEVLPEDIAVQIQGHVMSCPDCADLLAEAEGIRALLRRSEPEIMPDDVLDRLEATLVAARQAAAGRPAGETAPSTGPVRRIQPSVPGAGRVPVATEGGRGLSRLRGRAAEVTGARRQAREEERADEPGLLSRALPALRIAAAVVLVLGLGGVAVHFFAGSSSSDSGGSAASSAGPAVLAPVESTNTDYTKDALKSQVSTLVTQSQAAAGDAGGGASTFSAVTPHTASGAAGGATQDGSQLLRSQAALRACLDAIGHGDDQPVAVDLARYAGQEAAIIVLNSDSGTGYQVWVVARTCAPGADGTIDVLSVSAS